MEDGGSDRQCMLTTKYSCLRLQEGAAAAGSAGEVGGDQPPPGGRGGPAGGARGAARVAAVPRLLRPLHRPRQGGLGRGGAAQGRAHTQPPHGVPGM